MSYLNRLTEEFSELCNKVDKLESFLEQEDLDFLEAEDLELLEQQLWFMQGYKDILNERLDKGDS